MATVEASTITESVESRIIEFLGRHVQPARVSVIMAGLGPDRVPRELVQQALRKLTTQGRLTTASGGGGAGRPFFYTLSKAEKATADQNRGDTHHRPSANGAAAVFSPRSSVVAPSRPAREESDDYHGYLIVEEGGQAHLFRKPWGNRVFKHLVDRKAGTLLFIRELRLHS